MSETPERKQPLSFEQFVSALQQSQLAVYKQRENLDMQQKQYSDLVDTLIQFAAQTQKENAALRNEIEVLKGRLAELSNDSGQVESLIGEFDKKQGSN